MSTGETQGKGGREVAHRLFAAEFDHATFEYSEEDEERAPKYVVTPTGARVNRLFVVGVLTEVESVSDDVLRGRIADPTGAFVLYAGQYQPEAVSFLEAAEPPSFVAVTGKARTFVPDGSDRVFTSIRPESITAVDGATRDRWTVQTARQTLDRITAIARALDLPERGDDLIASLVDDGIEQGFAEGISLALDRYGTTSGFLSALRNRAIQAAELVADEREEVEPLHLAPDEGGEVELDLSRELPSVSTPTSAEAPTTGQVKAAQPVTTELEPDVDDEETDMTAEAGGTDELYELDAEEREQVEEEFGTEFSTGGEVEAPGEAGIETPGPITQEPAETETQHDEPPGGSEPVSAESGSREEVSDSTATEESDAQPDEQQGDAPTGDEPESLDIEEEVVETMRDLDKGDGVERDVVVSTVAEAAGIEEAAVEAAIQDALMSGKCYEPGDGRLKAI